jgi:hypothetical protein
MILTGATNVMQIEKMDLVYQVLEKVIKTQFEQRVV